MDTTTIWSEQISELATALSKAQGVMEPATKDSNNPFFKSKYADLASIIGVCRKPLYTNGLSFVQLPSTEGNIVTVVTVLLHSSGQWIKNSLSMGVKDNTPQAIGSCITYAKRYGLSAVIGIATEEDDDGNAATHTEIRKTSSNPGGITDPKDILLNQITMRSMLEKEALKKFITLTDFQAWRVDNNLVEDLDTLVDANGKENGLAFAKLLTAVREYKKAA